MSTPTVYLITCANRGIVVSIVTILAQRSNAIIYAGVRTLNGQSSLHDLASKHSNIHIVSLSSTSVSDAQCVVETIKQEHGHDCVAAFEHVRSVELAPAA